MNSTVAFNQTLPASTADWPLFPRAVRFDWRTSPLHWLPHNPFASDCVNHFSFTLVRGEYFFCRMMNKALPLVHAIIMRNDPFVPAHLFEGMQQQAPNLHYSHLQAGHWGILSQPQQLAQTTVAKIG